MTKRQKHDKKTNKGTNPKKAVEKNPAKGRAASTRGTGKTGPKPEPKIKPLPKGAKIPSRGTPRKLRNNPRPQKATERARNIAPKSQRAKAARQGKNNPKRKSFVETKREQQRITKQIEALKEQLSNLSVEQEKGGLDFSNTKKPINAKRTYQTKEGKKLKEKNVSGYRNIYGMDFPRGKFDTKVRFVNKLDLSFLDHGIKRNKKAPRAVIITLRSKTKKGSRYFKSTSAIDFVVNKTNIKKFLLETMIQWQDRFSLELYDKGDDYLEGSGKEFNPDNLFDVTFQFIY